MCITLFKGYSCQKIRASTKKLDIKKESLQLEPMTLATPQIQKVFQPESSFDGQIIKTHMAR